MLLCCLATVMHMLCFVARAGSRSVKTNGSKHRSWSSGLRDDQVHRFIVLVWSWRLNKRASVHTAWAKMTLSPTPPKSMIEVRRACRWIPLNQNCYRCYEWSTSGHTIVFYPRPSVLVRHVRPKRVHEHLVRATMSRFESTVLLRNPRVIALRPWWPVHVYLRACLHWAVSPCFSKKVPTPYTKKLQK